MKDLVKSFKPETLKSKTEIKELFHNGKRLTFFPLTLVYRSNSLNNCRYLFCTDRSIKRAVDRNRIKRILREIVSKKSGPQGFDIALIAKIEYGLNDSLFRSQIFLKLLKKIKK